MVTAQGPAECRAVAGGEAASEAACKPSSVPRKRGDGHPSRAPVTRRLLRPTRERGDAPLVRLTPHGLSYLAFHKVELARFTRRRPETPPTRLCGAGPRLSADGSYPLPCVAVLGLSSSGESPRRAQPSGHLAGEMTLAPAPRATLEGTVGTARHRASKRAVAPSGPPAVPPRRPTDCREGSRCLPWWSRRVPAGRSAAGGGQTSAGTVQVGHAEQPGGPMDPHVGQTASAAGTRDTGLRTRAWSAAAARIRRGSGLPGGPPQPDRRAPGWRARRPRGWWRAARASLSSGRTRPAAGVPPRGAA